eukprot:jgi/Bigna1/77833/fgenesh1_pg.50_\
MPAWVRIDKATAHAYSKARLLKFSTKGMKVEEADVLREKISERMFDILANYDPEVDPEHSLTYECHKPVPIERLKKILDYALKKQSTLELAVGKPSGGAVQQEKKALWTKERELRLRNDDVISEIARKDHWIQHLVKRGTKTVKGWTVIANEGTKFLHPVGKHSLPDPTSLSIAGGNRRYTSGDSSGGKKALLRKIALLEQENRNLRKDNMKRKKQGSAGATTASVHSSLADLRRRRNSPGSRSATSAAATSVGGGRNTASSSLSLASKNSKAAAASRRRAQQRRQRSSTPPHRSSSSSSSIAGTRRAASAGTSTMKRGRAARSVSPQPSRQRRRSTPTINGTTKTVLASRNKQMGKAVPPPAAVSRKRRPIPIKRGAEHKVKKIKEKLRDERAKAKEAAVQQLEEAKKSGKLKKLSALPANPRYGAKPKPIHRNSKENNRDWDRDGRLTNYTALAKRPTKKESLDDILANLDD